MDLPFQVPIPTQYVVDRRERSSTAMGKRLLNNSISALAWHEHWGMQCYEKLFATHPSPLPPLTSRWSETVRAICAISKSTLECSHPDMGWLPFTHGKLTFLRPWQTHKQWSTYVGPSFADESNTCTGYTFRFGLRHVWSACSCVKHFSPYWQTHTKKNKFTNASIHTRRHTQRHTYKQLLFCFPFFFENRVLFCNVRADWLFIYKFG